ncbi:Scarecrow-like transcription factor pat1, partial [Thalictrum thalictroides]
MQSSRNPEELGGSHKLYYHHMQGPGSYCLPSNYQTQEHSLSSDDCSQGTRYCIQSSHENYCTLESSSSAGSYTVYHSPSTVSVSSNGSPLSQKESESYPSDPYHSPENTHGSPISASCITDDVDLRNKLRELETMMLGPDSDIVDSLDSTFQNENNQSSSEPERWKQIMEVIPRGDLKQVLIACGKAVSDGDMIAASWLMGELRKMVSVSGEPIQRLGAYMLEGLVAKLALTG